jgi:bacillithiol system protein YtxJ
MHWIHLTEEDQLQHLVVRSQEKPQVIFKYSNHCNLSNIILHRLEKNCCPEQVDFYFVDLISFRSVSNKISDRFHVDHESPQILVIKDGECVFEESHSAISLDEILNRAQINPQ